MKIFHHAQRASADGTTYGDAVSETVQSSSLGQWELFVRETLQNSWDARDESRVDDGVTFAIDYLDLERDQIDFLRDSILGNNPVGLNELEKSLNSGSLSMLVVSDRGTHGLRGTTKNTVGQDGESDFVSFVRNIGRSQEKKLGGGTFGFGKAVIFKAGRTSTVLTYSRTKDADGHDCSRFIAIANGPGFTHENTYYTGRHWWGEQRIDKNGENRTEYAEPITGRDADFIAESLGLDGYFTDNQPYGTSIAILDPRFDTDNEEKDASNAFEKLPGYLAKWAWPHMIDTHTGMDPITFIVNRNGKPLEIPDPKEDLGLRHLVKAYEIACKEAPSEPNEWQSTLLGKVAVLAMKRPKNKRLGKLAVRLFRAPVEAENTVLDMNVSGLVATMRKPRMIVEYKQDVITDALENYCGAFVADDEADPVFARSEPSAHDRWDAGRLDEYPEDIKAFHGGKTNPVASFERLLKEVLRTALQNREAGSEDIDPSRIAPLERSLGRFIPNSLGGKATSKISKTSEGRKPPVTTTPAGRVKTQFLGLRLVNGRKLAEYEITASPKKPNVELQVTPFIASDSGRMSADDLEKAHLESPKIFDWGPEDDSDVSKRILDNGTETFIVRVLQPVDSVIGIDTTLVAPEEGTDRE